MTETGQAALGAEFEFLELKEVASVLHVAPVSIYRLIAKRTIPVYRTCRKILFRKNDVLDFLEQRRQESTRYGSS